MTIRLSLLLVAPLLVLMGCQKSQNQTAVTETIVIQDSTSDSLNQVWSERIVVPGFGAILDSNELQGAVLFYDVQRGKWLSNDFEWAEKRRLPASTFKIVNSIIGLETGKVSMGKTEFVWDGKPRRMKQWERDFDLKAAFHASCVPCYQDLARRIGVDYMTNYLDTFHYGNMIVDTSSIDVFWLEGESGVSQVEQINFLRAFYNKELPIKARTTDAMKSLMIIDQSDVYTLSGKTGWAIRNGNNNGWFVGYIEQDNNLFFFATNVTPSSSFNMDLFPKIRSEVTLKAFGMVQGFNQDT